MYTMWFIGIVNTVSTDFLDQNKFENNQSLIT